MNARFNFSLPSAYDWQFTELVCEKLRIFYDITLLFLWERFLHNQLGV